MRRLLSLLLSTVLFLVPAISICTNSQTLLPDVDAKAMTSHHSSTEGESNCAGNCLNETKNEESHMQTFASIAPASQSDIFIFLALAVVALVSFFRIESGQKTAQNVRPHFREWIYFFRIPSLVYAFQRGILHPKIHA